MRASLAVLIVLLAVSPLACDYVAEGDPYRIGLELSPNGAAVRVLYADCHRPVRIRAVEVARQRVHLLWAITSAGSLERAFQVGGEPPSGFETSVPLATALLPGTYIAVVDSDYLMGETMSFKTSDLRAGEVLLGDHYLSEAEFSDQKFC